MYIHILTYSIFMLNSYILLQLLRIDLNMFTTHISVKIRKGINNLKYFCFAKYYLYFLHTDDIPTIKNRERIFQ